MKKQLLTLTLAAAALTSGFAATAPSVTSFPPLNIPKEGAAVQNGMSRAPLNQDAAKGLKVFGSTFIDCNIVRNFANYYQNQYMLDKLSPIYKSGEKFEEMPSIYMIHAGAYCPDDGYYYAYRVQYYTIGITYSDSWLRVDPKDGSWEIITELDNKAHESTYLYDMAYSPYDGEMYGLVQNSDGQIKSRIGLINMDNSEVYDMVQLPHYYFAAAFDYEGNMYGVRWILTGEDDILTGTALDVFDKSWNLVSSRELKVNGAPYLGYYQHGLDMDYTTGDLIWAGTDVEGVQHMFRINPDTAEVEDWGGIGWNETMIGLYVPYTVASHREAPAVVTGKTFAIDPQGANSVTLSWTNPTTTWNRQPLTDLQKVVIYRDEHKGNPIGEVTAAGQEGKGASFTDTGASQGVHKYYIIAVNAKGEGVESSIDAYVGHDVPGPVQNITVKAVDNGNSAELSWSAPVTGDSDGWFDKNITYDIVRLPDNVQVATGLAATTFTDRDIPEAKFYSYSITPVSADGRGTAAVSDGVLAGASLAIPFATNFQNRTEADRFPSFDNFGTPNLFEYSNNNNTGNTMCMLFMFDKSSDATLSSPKMNVRKGQQYRVNWTFSLNRYGYTFEDCYYHLRVMGGASPDHEAMTDVLQDLPDFLCVKNHQVFTVTTYFTAPVDGDYCVGLNVLVPEDRTNDWMYVTGFSISERLDNDLAVTDFKCPVSVSAVDDNFFDVEIHNAGINAQDKYKVEVGVSRLDGVFVPFASTSDVPSLAADARKTVRVVGKPGEYGVQDIMARVVMDNDANKDNDTSDLCEAAVNGAPAFNYTATDESSEWLDTSMPIYTWYSNTLSQTIYTPEMLGLPAGENPIGGLAWEYEADEDMTNVKLQVELTTFDRDHYSASRAAYVSDGLKRVFDGSVNLEEGQNHWMVVSFPDNAYLYDGTKNLVVTVYAEAPSSSTFPLRFRLFNSASASSETDNRTHTLTSRNNGAITMGQGTIFSHQEYPKLHVALKGSGSGINGTSADGEFGISLRGNKVLFSGDVRSAAVYDMNGRLIRSAAMNGNAAIDLNLAPGVYVVMARDAAGNVKTLKFVAR